MPLFSSLSFAYKYAHMHNIPKEKIERVKTEKVIPTYQKTLDFCTGRKVIDRYPDGRPIILRSRRVIVWEYLVKTEGE